MSDDSESNKQTEQVENLSPRSNIGGDIDHLQVETAVKFLRNPKVAGTPIERQVAFLKQKGLTEDEISLARSTAGVSNTPAQNQDNGIMPQGVAQVMRPNGNQSGRWRDWMGTALVGAGVIYGLSYFVKSQILPLVFGHGEAESKEKSEELKVTLQELREGFGGVAVELRNTFRQIQNHLEDQRQATLSLTTELQELKGRVTLISSDTTSLAEMKNELSSLKGLVLGRRQFPPSPFSITGGGSSIPAWQKISSSPSKPTNDASSMPSSSSLDTASSRGPVNRTEFEKIGNVGLLVSNVEGDASQVGANNGDIGLHQLQDSTAYANPFVNSFQEGFKVDDTPADATKELSNPKNEKAVQPSEGASEVSSSSDTSIVGKVDSSEESMDSCILLKGSSSDTIAQMYVDLDVTSTN